MADVGKIELDESGFYADIAGGTAELPPATVSTEVSVPVQPGEQAIIRRRELAREDRRKKVKELWLQGEIIRKIASAVATSESTVKKDLKAMGLRLRKI
jgi:DNA-binding NarL/FixJ family response regulator